MTEAVAPGLVGPALLGDRVRPGATGVGPLLALGWVLTLAGVALLARAPIPRAVPAA